jgi:hypothetical protein
MLRSAISAVQRISAIAIDRRSRSFWAHDGGNDDQLGHFDRFC